MSIFRGFMKFLCMGFPVFKRCYFIYFFVFLMFRYLFFPLRFSLNFQWLFSHLFTFFLALILSGKSPKPLQIFFLKYLRKFNYFYSTQKQVSSGDVVRGMQSYIDKLERRVGDMQASFNLIKNSYLV